MRDADATLVRLSLADLVLGDDATVRVSARVATERGRWPHLTQLAAQWRVTPQLSAALGRSGATAELPDGARSTLRGQVLAYAARSAQILRACSAAQAVLVEAGVVSVAIKGIASIATLYGASSRRMIADVDLVIAPEDLAAARSALERTGHRDIAPPFESHVAAIGFSRYLHNYARTFVRDGIEIDLHWKLGPRPPAALEAGRIIARSLQKTVEGRTLRVSGPVETALAAVHHALRSSFPAASTLKDASDLLIWWECEGRSHGDALIACAHESRIASSVSALARTIARRNAGHPIARAVAEIEQHFDRAQRREAVRLAAFIERNFVGDAPDDATVELMTPALVVRSIAGPLLAGNRRLTPAEPLETGAPLASRAPLLHRIGNRLRRARRIGGELLSFRRIATYRAVARAQSRYH